MPKPSGDGRFGEVEPQLEQFSVNARRSPGRIFCGHPEDQGPYLLAQWLSATDLPGPGEPFPMQAEASPVPIHHRAWRDQNEGLFPPRPEPLEKNPEQLLPCRQTVVRSCSVQCWRKARFSRMRFRRELRELMIQPRRCRRSENMARSYPNAVSLDRLQVAHFAGARSFDAGATRLSMLPAQHTTWGQWRREHPGTLVLSPDTGFKHDYSVNPYRGY